MNYPFEVKCIKKPECSPYINVDRIYTAVAPHDTRDDFFAVRGELDTIAYYPKKCFRILPSYSPKKFMWEIFVPTVSNEGKPFRTRYHRVWDAKVRAIANGLTIFRPAVGQWEFEGTLFKERMIPVRILCTEKEIEAIADMTAKYYDQLAVCFFKFGEGVVKNYPVKS